MASSASSESAASNTALLEDALRALSASSYRIIDALERVPDAPGLYGVYGSAAAWAELGLGVGEDVSRALYVGKAERSLVSRDLKTHFASGRTGSSTLRRSFAALLKEVLDLEGRPRNLAKPERFANFAIEPAADERLTAWMQAHLRLSVWVKRADAILDKVESEVMNLWQPPLNLAKARSPSTRLKDARRQMAEEGRRWAETQRLP
jgi:hypothetical protein